MIVITLKTILEEKVGYHFFQVTVAQPEWERRGNGLPFARNKLAQIFASALYQFSGGLENKPAMSNPRAKVLSQRFWATRFRFSLS